MGNKGQSLVDTAELCVDSKKMIKDMHGLILIIPCGGWPEDHKYMYMYIHVYCLIYIYIADI